MDKRMLVLGGAFLAGGGLLYWYLSQKPPNGNGNGNEHGCRGECHYEGYTECDRYNNLCKCVKGEGILLERNSPKCLSGLYHNECFPSIPGGIITCLPVPGSGIDRCPNVGFSTGCYCTQGECDIKHWCEPLDSRCLLKAVSTPISATTGNMDCFDHEGSSYCNYYFDEPLAAITIIGDLHYKWGPVWPGEWVDWGVFGYYKGRWTTFGGGTPWISAPEGTIPIMLSFAAQGIEMLQFGIGALVSNIHVDKFIGHLHY